MAQFRILESTQPDTMEARDFTLYFQHLADRTPFQAGLRALCLGVQLWQLRGSGLFNFQLNTLTTNEPPSLSYYLLYITK